VRHCTPTPANRNSRDFGREIAHAAVPRRPPIPLYHDCSSYRGLHESVGVVPRSLSPRAANPHRPIRISFPIEAEVSSTYADHRAGHSSPIPQPACRRPHLPAHPLQVPHVARPARQVTACRASRRRHRCPRRRDDDGGGGGA
jgi:hypothetical protein